jgi:superfamily II DNA or RNA helicase
VGAASDDSVAARPGGPLQKMAFRYSFRKDQRLILGQLEQQTRHAIGDRRYHLAVPPGSGETIIGRELIRRFGVPPWCSDPTTTIQQQWRDEVWR